ncbi:YrhK family protein [Rubrimonas cliftonensis]|uniref:YrhK-like protein n=1 Tax=Rubrimonas cliftonensis TaxID=89524 RepID=A0A1H4B571_9RHOB|nr:YrhK family protein [Rubrimonas cliftonensis]SEA43280.1 YrhK-like protein [Rubrimonas cliftonensis]
MRLFHPDARTRDTESARLYAEFEVAYTVVDFAAAVFFVVGSILFFNGATVTAGIWMFLIGSLCFAAKPSLRLARELRDRRRGQIDRLADRARE